MHLAVIFFALMCAGCLHETKKDDVKPEIVVTDSMGNKIAIPKKPKRMATFGYDADEILLALVPKENLVAVSPYLDDENLSPQPIVQKAKTIKRKVKDPSVEEIFSWQPDLIFANPWTSLEKIQALRDLKIPVVVIGPGNSYQAIRENIWLMAQSVGEEENGKKILNEMEHVLQEITNKTKKIPLEKRKRVVLLSMMMNYGGSGSAFDDMCQRAYVINAPVDKLKLKNGQTLTKEGLLQCNPDFFLLPNFDNHGEWDLKKFIESYTNDPALKNMPAIREKRFYFPREKYIYNASQDFVFGVQELAFYAYGDEFAQPDNRHITTQK